MAAEGSSGESPSGQLVRPNQPEVLSSSPFPPSGSSPSSPSWSPSLDCFSKALWPHSQPCSCHLGARTLIILLSALKISPDWGASGRQRSGLCADMGRGRKSRAPPEPPPTHKGPGTTQQSRAVHTRFILNLAEAGLVSPCREEIDTHTHTHSLSPQPGLLGVTWTPSARGPGREHVMD